MSRPFAVLFPGQGAQEVGMGKDLFEEDTFLQALAETASQAIEKDISMLCKKGPDRQLCETAVLQPALTCVCLGLWRRFSESGLTPAAFAGHSVGELSALSASGAAEPVDTVLLAAARGKLMRDAAAKRDGAMAAVSGVPYETVVERIESYCPPGATLVVGAVNAPSQVTISGDKDLVSALAVPGAIPGARVTMLRVSGAWHSPHMKAAAAAFEARFTDISIRDPEVPMILNRDGASARTVASLREGIPGQLFRPVRWDLVMHRLLDSGIRNFVEIGPGKVLRGLVRLSSPSPDIEVHNIFDLRSLHRAVSALKGA